MTRHDDAHAEHGACGYTLTREGPDVCKRPGQAIRTGGAFITCRPSVRIDPTFTGEPMSKKSDGGLTQFVDALHRFAACAVRLKDARDRFAKSYAAITQEPFVSGAAPDGVLEGMIDALETFQEKVQKERWQFSADYKATIASAATPAHPIGGMNPAEWRVALLCEVDELHEALSVQSDESLHRAVTNDTWAQCRALLKDLIARAHEARHAAGIAPATPEGQAAAAKDKIITIRKGASAPRADTDAGSGQAEDNEDLSPSRIKAGAVYDWALGCIAGADRMTRTELYNAIAARLGTEAARANGRQAELLATLRDSLPPNADAFARYLRDAGVKVYGGRGDRLPGRSIRRVDQV